MYTAVRMLTLLLIASALPAAAAGESPEAAPETAGSAQDPGGALPSLDSLLRPRDHFDVPNAPASGEERGGRDEEAWRLSFSQLHGEVAQLEARVDALQEQIRTAAGGEWNYSPVPGGESTDPELLKLRTKLRRDRKSLETAEERLRDLDVEASLSGVPDDWRGASSGR